MICGYAAFLQNAGLGVVVYPERCSGLVYGVPLGHGVEVGGGGGCLLRPCLKKLERNGHGRGGSG